MDLSADIELSGADARALTDRIKIAVEGTWQLIQQAYVSRAWSVLGYSSWDDYCTREFGTSRLRLPREERQEVVASLRESGLSTRAIAAATGLNQATISRSLPRSGDAFASPDGAKVTGLDGKSYSAGIPPNRFEETSAEEPTTGAVPEKKRRPLGDAFRDASYELQKLAERVERLVTDDRFTRNAEQIALASRADLLRALDLLTAAVERIPVPNPKG